MPLEDECDIKAQELMERLKGGKEIDSATLGRLDTDELRACLALLQKAYLKLSK